MASPLEAILGGIRGRQEFDQINAQQNLAQAAAQPGFNSAFSPEMQQVAAFSNDPAAGFLALSKQKQQSFFDDAQKGLNFAKQGKWKQVTNLAQKRLANITRSNGDPADTLAVINAVANQDFGGATQLLQSGVDLGIQAGALKQQGTAAGREKVRLFKMLKAMPFKTEEQKSLKTQFARIIGAEGKQQSLEDKLQFQIDKQKIAGDIKVQQDITKAGGAESAKLTSQFKLKPLVSAGVETALINVRTAAEAAKGNRSKSLALNLYNTGIKGLSDSLGGTSTGVFAGLIPAMTANQQIAEGAGAAMAPILKQIFRAAGEGVFTDQDQALLIGMLPSRKTAPKARLSMLSNIDLIVQAKLKGEDIQPLSGPSLGGQQPAAGQFNSSKLGRSVSEQDITDTLSANPGMTREQLFQQLGIQ